MYSTAHDFPHPSLFPPVKDRNAVSVAHWYSRCWAGDLVKRTLWMNSTVQMWRKYILATLSVYIYIKFYPFLPQRSDNDSETPPLIFRASAPHFLFDPASSSSDGIRLVLSLLSTVTDWKQPYFPLSFLLFFHAILKGSIPQNCLFLQREFHETCFTMEIRPFLRHRLKLN